MMRFKRGSKVEVLSKKEVPSGSWQCAEIIFGNGHYYTVRYDISGGATVVEKVSRKDIRPCPPPAQSSEEWLPGDLVEVFHNSAWKLATISEVLGKKHVMVRLLGSSWEFKVSNFDIRVRRSWQDDQWVVIGKSSKNYDNEMNSQQHVCAPSKNLKRTLVHFSSKPEAKAKRVKPNNKNNNSNDKDRCPQAIGSGLHETSRQKITRMGRFQTGLTRCSFETNDDDAVSVASSVASCSISGYNSNEDWPRHMVRLDSGDAESFYRSRCGEGKELAAEIHRLELHAYRCTMEALHASGPLSWEQEEMMTNLRLSLHISNDEHLVELRNLVSADTTTINLR